MWRKVRSRAIVFDSSCITISVCFYAIPSKYDMNQFGQSCFGGAGNCNDHGHGAAYAGQNSTYHALEGVVPRGGVSVHFENLDSLSTYSSNSDLYRNEPAQHLQHQQREMYADQPIAPSPSPAGALATTGDGENQCQCEYLMFDNFKWVKQRHYVVAKDGRDYFDRYVVTYRLPNSNVQYDMFTYSEGSIMNGPIESKFPFLCGEVAALHALPPVNSLSSVCYYTPPLVDPQAPFHVQEEVCKKKSLDAVPLTIDNNHQVLVIRTFNNSLAVQLMPSAFSEKTILSGTPLFHPIRNNICGTVGNMFSEFYYVINGAPCFYALFSIGGKEKGDQNEGDRLRVVILDRRDRADSEEWSANETVLNSITDVATPVLQRAEGKHARLDVRDILYVGVVNNKLQITDAPNITKKYKAPKNAVVAVIDNRGVYATLIREKEIVTEWVQKDANVVYSVLPRNFFDKPRSSVLRINTADTNSKMKRAKSKELLV